MAAKSTMKALTLAAYGKPSTYGLATLPVPSISTPDEILIEVRAASINPIDVKRANGALKMMIKDEFPLRIGYDVAGRVVEVGKGVKSFKVGDEVFSRVEQNQVGTVAEYALSSESAAALKPASLSYAEAASIPLVALTALQSLELAESKLSGGIKGKTVFVPAGLSGTGSYAIQLAKNVYGADKVITTLSTGKLEKAKELLGAQTFEPIDYTKQDVAATVGNGTVDYFFDTMGQTVGMAKLVKRGGTVVSISTVPAGDGVAEALGGIPTLLRYLLNAADWFFRWWVGRYGGTYDYVFMHPSGDDLRRVSKWVEEGKVKPIVGRTARLDDIEAVRQGCQEVYDGKGGLGKFVIEM